MSDDGTEHGAQSAPNPTLELPAAPRSGPWLLDVGSSAGASAVALRAGERLVIGGGRRADLRVSDHTVSSRHARISGTPLGVEVEDLGSRNGLYVGGARVGSALLGDQCSFVVGRTTVVLRPLEDNDEDGDGPAASDLVGASQPMRRLRREIGRVAPVRGPVLLQGESGSGKDVVARCLHSQSRRSGAFVPINVGAITESLADAEMFGHRRGAFTGAVASRAGAFEEAHRGTLFLDEIAELSAAAQVKLLRVVEDGAVRPVGAAQPLEVDVRIVSATWASLRDRVESGQFREDLYHRIATFVIAVPPLRQRKSDIPALGERLLGRLRDEVGHKDLSSAAVARLVAYDWPGNVRELGSVLYRAAVLADGSRIGGEQIDRAIGRPSRVRAAALTASEAKGLLDAHHGNISAAARAAGVARSTFRSWLAKPSA